MGPVLVEALLELLFWDVCFFWAQELPANLIERVICFIENTGSDDVFKGFSCHNKRLSLGELNNGNQFFIVLFYNVAVNTELVNTEPFLPGKICHIYT